MPPASLIPRFVAWQFYGVSVLEAILYGWYEGAAAAALG